VPLPHRPRQSEQNGAVAKPPVWSIARSETASFLVPLPAKCDKHGQPNGVCCKELKGDDERHLVDPDIVRDVVIGLSDGLTVPFALAAGLSSLGESRLVVLGGVAELIAGAISMGIGGFLASQAERDHYRYLAAHTSARVVRSCQGEMEREVNAVLGPVGVDEKLCRQVAQCLRQAEIADEDNLVGGEQPTKLRWSKTVGLTPFLLRFGEGLEEIPTKRLFTSAFTIGMGYLVGGLIPLFPYFLTPHARTGLLWSSILTGIVLLIFGWVKTYVTGAGKGWTGYVWGAVSTLMVGGAAAGAAFAIVAALEA